MFGDPKINVSTLKNENDRHRTKYRNAGEAQLDISVFIQCIEGSASRFSSGKRTTNRQYEREETRHETQDDDVLGIVTCLPLPPSFRPP